MRAKPKPFPTETSPCPRALVSPSLLRARPRGARAPKEAEGLRRVATRCAHPPCAWARRARCAPRWRRGNAEGVDFAAPRDSPGDGVFRDELQRHSPAFVQAHLVHAAERELRDVLGVRGVDRRAVFQMRRRGARGSLIRSSDDSSSGLRGRLRSSSRVALPASRPSSARANAPCQGPISKDPPGARRTCAFARAGSWGAYRARQGTTSSRRRSRGGGVCHPHARGGVVRRRSRARVRHARAEHPRTLEVRQARRQPPAVSAPSASGTSTLLPKTLRVVIVLCRGGGETS